MFILSGFGDEISPELNEQLDLLQGEGVLHLELRGVWNKNVLDLTDAEAARVKAELDRRGFGVSAIGSPIGKIGIDDPFEPHLARFRRALDLAEFFHAPYIRLFSFYVPEGQAAHYRAKVLAQMRALGANPQVMAFSEVYQALQTGVVDGTENPPSNFYTQKMHEVQKYLTLSDHGYLGYAVIVNKKFWEGLPANIRVELEKSMEEATRYANDIAKQENDNALELVKASGKTKVLTLTPEEKAAWRKTLLTVHETQDRVPQELIKRIYQAIGFKK